MASKQHRNGDGPREGSRRDGFAGDRAARRSVGSRTGVRLSQVLDDTTFVACDDLLATGCHDDPLKCGPGDIFVARLTAERDVDGHELVAEAVARGCSGIVAERIVPTFGAPLCVVGDASSAYTRIVHALAGNPATSLEVIAVTGTSGKTTTAWLIASVLAEAGISVGVLSDLGCLDASSMSAEPAERFEDPHRFAAWLTRLATSGCTHAVIEVSSRMLARQALAGIECGTVAMTNLSSAHLDVHGSRHAYHAIKRRILGSLSSQGCFVGNADDPVVAALAARHDGRSIMAGLRIAADLTATPVERSLDGQTFLLRSSREMMPIAVSTPLASFARNSLVAAATGIAHGVSLMQIARGLESAGSVSGRAERIDHGQDFACFVDHPSCGHQLASTLASLRHLTPGRLVAVADAVIAERLGGADQVVARLTRWCDDAAVLPARIGHESAGTTRFLAGFDRILSALGTGDCLLVVGDVNPPIGPFDTPGERMSARLLTEGWIRMAYPPGWSEEPRRAA